MEDPDMGVSTYSYNAFGELLSQTDAKGQTVSMSYDALGRMTERIEAEGTTTWEYDTEDKGIGKLSSLSGPDGYVESYVYDVLGRVHSQTVSNAAEGTSFTTGNRYDEYGRVDSLIYPSGFTVRNVYDSLGYLKEVRRADNDYLYWRADVMNARGQLEQQSLGNGMVTLNGYDPLTGRIETIRTGNIQGYVQDLEFSFNKIGNLTERRDHAKGFSESFGYDALNRLVTTSVQNGWSTIINYDALGNIQFRSDVGCYIYGENGAGPHAVTSIKDAFGNVMNSYSYDANGNRISSSFGSVQYTSYNKPHTISKGANTLHFVYGPNRNRQKQEVLDSTGAVVSTKYYVGGIYEKEEANGLTKELHYIMAGGTTIAIYTQQSDGQHNTRYLHKDHLGSIESISNEVGQVVETLSFDAWGRRRNANTWGPLSTSFDGLFDRGFTFHEHLDLVGLIHMNGRVYDPLIGRFLSPDPFVQMPAYSQSLNRYSYVLNNPLSLTDPSGYFFGKIWKFVKKVFKKAVRFVKKHWKAITAVAVGIVTGGIASAIIAPALGFSSVLAGTIFSAAGFGFGSTFTSTLLHGGSIGDALKMGIRSAVISGAAAGALYGIDRVFPTWMQTNKLVQKYVFNKNPLSVMKRVGVQLSRSLSRGLVNGLSGKLQGGSFVKSFGMSTVSDFVRWGRDAFVEYREKKDPFYPKVGEQNYEVKARKAAQKLFRSGSTWQRGKGEALPKIIGKQAVADPTARNIGIPRNRAGTGWFYNTWIFEAFVSEASPFMGLVNLVPGMNSMSVFHDHWAVYSGNLGGYPLKFFTNQMTIPIAIGIEYVGLLGDYAGTVQALSKK